MPTKEKVTFEESMTRLEEIVGLLERGDAPLEDVAQALGVPLPCQSFDTFNGLVFGAIDTIPEDGTTLEVETAGLTIQVTKIRNHQAAEALVRLHTPAEPTAD